MRGEKKMKTKEMTKGNGKKKAMVLVLSASLLAGAIGFTSAYFTDHHAVMNEFTVGQVKTELTETKWDTDPSGKTAATELRPNMTIVKDPVVENTGTSDCYTFVSFRVPYSNFAALGQFGTRNINARTVVGQCDDFNVSADGSVDINYKDLFEHKVNTDSWVLVEDKADMSGKYHEYVYAFANGTGGGKADTTDMKVMKKGDKTTPLFTSDKIRTINLVEDEWAKQHGCELTENAKFNIPVRVYSIQTTDLVNTDGVNDIGKTKASDVWKVVKAQVDSKYEGMKEANWGNVLGANDGKGNDASNHSAAMPKPLH